VEAGTTKIDQQLEFKKDGYISRGRRGLFCRGQNDRRQTDRSPPCSDRLIMHGAYLQSLMRIEVVLQVHLYFCLLPVKVVWSGHTVNVRKSVI
jgi:hypothetical protein